MAQNNQDLDVEINLVSFISLLSVCICFLLLTAIWIQVGSLNVKQAVGGQSAAETKKTPAVWAQMGADGAVVLKLHDFSRAETRKLGGSRLKIKVSSEPDEVGLWDKKELGEQVSLLQSINADFRTALIIPNSKTKYENVIKLMDHFKEFGMKDLGVSPL